MSGLPAKTGLVWLRQGFALFRKQPGILAMLWLSNFLFAILLSPLPLVGAILPLVFIPSFTIAIQQACCLIDDGQRVTPIVLFTGFRKDAFTRLCTLGLVYFAVLVLLAIVVSPWIDLESVRQAAKMIEANKPPVIDEGTKMAVLSFVMLGAVAMLALSFAPGVTYWKRMPLFKALFYSVVAVFGAARAFVVMLLSLFCMYWVAAIIAGLVFGRSALVFIVIAWLNLICLLVFQCAIYVAYKQILGTPEQAP
jgi:hypothetical protein